MLLNTSLPNLRGEHWTKPVPPEPHRLMADIDTPLKQEIFDLPQRQRIANVVLSHVSFGQPRPGARAVGFVAYFLEKMRLKSEGGNKHKPAPLGPRTSGLFVRGIAVTCRMWLAALRATGFISVNIIYTLGLGAVRAALGLCNPDRSGLVPTVTAPP